MPCITIPADIARGPLLIGRVGLPDYLGGGSPRKCRILVSSSHTESLIAPCLAASLRHSPRFQAPAQADQHSFRFSNYWFAYLQILVGGMGRPLSVTTLRRVTLIEHVDACRYGVILGRDVIARGQLTMNATSYTLCI